MNVPPARFANSDCLHIIFVPDSTISRKPHSDVPSGMRASLDTGGVGNSFNSSKFYVYRGISFYYLSHIHSVFSIKLKHRCKKDNRFYLKS